VRSFEHDLDGDRAVRCAGLWKWRLACGKRANGPPVPKPQMSASPTISVGTAGVVATTTQPAAAAAGTISRAPSVSTATAGTLAPAGGMGMGAGTGAGGMPAPLDVDAGVAPPTEEPTRPVQRCPTKAYVSNSGADSVSIIDTNTHEVLTTVRTDKAPVNPTFTPDRRQVYVANSQASTLTIIDVETDKVTTMSAGGERPSGLAFSPDGQTLYVSLISQDYVSPGNVLSIQLSSGKASAPLRMGADPERIALTPSGDRLYVNNLLDGTMAVIDTATFKISTTLTLGDLPFNPLMSPDGSVGEERWRFDSIESTGDVWGDSSVNSGGGAWYPPSIDIASGRVFWAIANPAPFPGTPQFPNGSSRPGLNLYSDSTLVLEAKTGKYQWHHQTVQHDLFDRDLLHTMLTEVAGTQIVVSTGKEGRVWANRRDDGKVFWGPTEVGMHKNDQLTELTAATEVLPGSFGGVLTPPALADGVVYVAELNAPSMYLPNQTSYFGSQVGTMKGNLVAIDAATGDIKWDVLVDGDPTGGVTVVNDLVITATLQGSVIAYQRETGKEVWRWQAPGGINSWMSVAGDTLVIPVGSSNPAVIVALRLGAASGSPTAGAPAAGSGSAGRPAAGGGAPAPAATFSSIYRDILATRCAGPVCHGGSSAGGSLNVTGATASAARGTLIGRAASGSECASSGLPLVTPGQPDKSLLYLKLTDMPQCGSRMPPTGGLSAADVERVRAWIANGAADD